MRSGPGPFLLRMGFEPCAISLTVVLSALGVACWLLRLVGPYRFAGEGASALGG